jgi:hypothetical protein
MTFGMNSRPFGRGLSINQDRCKALFGSHPACHFAATQSSERADAIQQVGSADSAARPSDPPDEHPVLQRWGLPLLLLATGITPPKALYETNKEAECLKYIEIYFDYSD